MIGPRRSRRYRALLRELGSGPTDDVGALCKRLAARRGRPVILRAYPIQVPGVYGACMSAANTDVIFYEARTSRVHQDHIILHELVHLAAGHEGVSGDDAAMRFPSLASHGEDRCLRRHGPRDSQEIEAEAVASISLGWTSSLDPRAWMRCWRIYRDLAPLWLVLRSACPRIPAGRKPAFWWPPWQMHRRAYRRLIECRDGLVRLGQCLDEPGSREERDLAARLVAAADLASSGRPALWAAGSVTVPRSPGLDAEADALVSLSRAIASSGCRLRRWPVRHPARFG